MKKLYLFVLAVPILSLIAFAHPYAAADGSSLGYYRFPAIHGDTIVLTAEGDLWRVGVNGGVAQRLTTHPAEESRAAISPDGKTIAFSAAYEGPTEVYTLSIEGGVPVRQTYEGGNALVVGWSPSGDVLYSTRRFSTLPNTQLARVNPTTGARTLVPLAQASDGSYDANGRTLYFTRLAFQGSYTKRYQGGTAQNLWRFGDGDREAAPLTQDYNGTSKNPMLWNGRLYFLSDRDGTMNIWSIAERGGDPRQHTRHSGLDASSPSLSDGRIAYQLGADIRIFDIASGEDRAVPIRLVSDFDQLREKWIKAPLEWVTSAHVSPTGDRVVLTARGQVFVVPAQQGRIVEATRDKKIRYREGRFFPDGKSLLTLSDQSGEVEFWKVPANGVGDNTQLTADGKVLRWDGIASSDGTRIAHFDKNQQLWVYDIASKTNKRIAECGEGDFADVTWSPDGKWLAYAAPDRNQMTRLYLYSPETDRITPVTTDRYDSYSPAWSPDGKWLYFLSDRNFVSAVQSPWGSRQPEPFFDKQTKMYLVSLKPGERSPFQPDDELSAPASDEKTDQKKDEKKDEKKDTPAPAAQGVQPPLPAVADLTGIETRLLEVPLSAGNYSNLATDGKRLYFMSSDVSSTTRPALKTLAIENKSPKPETFAEDVSSYELTLDHKKLMLRKAQDIFIFDVAAKAPADSAKNKVALADWAFRLDPRDEWRQMFTEAWRLERDYFYDRNMEKVLARREVNRKMLEQYVLDETETFEVLGPGQWPLQRTKRDYTWYERDGMHVRSPVRFDGVAVGEKERAEYEEKWIKREKARQERKAKNEREKSEIVIGSEGLQVNTGGPVTTEPRFVSEAYFMDFKFEPGNYYLAGREKLEGQDVLRIEYYPTNLFNDTDDEKTPHEMKKKPSSKDPKKQEKQQQAEDEINRKMNKTALVTLWVDPAEHQIVKYTFDNVWMDFLPAGWLVKIDDIRASMTMGQPFPGVWLPRGMKFPNVVLPGEGPMLYADVGTALEASVVTWDDLKWIREAWEGKIVVKGVHIGDDARRAIDAGADAVVVSNHGGRQLDDVHATIRALPEVVAAVRGQIEVLVDGGIRSGSDVAKALCLGARAVLVGRAYAYGLGAAGEPGVRRAVEILRADLLRTIKLLGCPSTSALDRSYVEVPDSWHRT